MKVRCSWPYPVEPPIDFPVNLNGNQVGKVVKYDRENRLVTIELDDIPEITVALARDPDNWEVITDG